MNQTRSFLLLAWAMVAALLWMQWNAEHAPKQPAANATTTQSMRACRHAGADGHDSFCTRRSTRPAGAAGDNASRAHH